MGDTSKTKKRLILPEDATMSLGDHLEELRMRLLRALLGLGIGLFIALFFGRSIVRFLEGPYNDATAKFLFGTKIEFQGDLDKGVISESFRRQFIDNGFPISGDITVTNKSILWKGERWLVTDSRARYWIRKGKDELRVYEQIPLMVIAVAAGFVSYIKIALITGLILSSPWVFYQLWMFVAAGLYPHERQYVYYAVPFSAVLFICGALFFLFVVAPLTVGFLVKFNERILEVRSQFTFQHYITFVSHLMLVFGLAFQTPIAIFFLNKTGLVSIQALSSSRKFVILAVVIVAAMATPPDVISQITLAIPLYLLFELGILLCYFANRKKTSPE
jgi:sec-independent protein translocase protein TatC